MEFEHNFLEIMSTLPVIMILKQMRKLLTKRPAFIKSVICLSVTSPPRDNSEHCNQRYQIYSTIILFQYMKTLVWKALPQWHTISWFIT